MRHKWIKLRDTTDHCTKCGLTRRKVIRECPGVNRTHPAYRVVEISNDDGVTWKWLKGKTSMPKCPGYPKPQR